VVANDGGQFQFRPESRSQRQTERKEG